MAYTFKTKKGTATAVAIPTSVDVASYTLTVEFSRHSDFSNILSTKSVTGSGKIVSLSLTASEVDTLKDTRYRLKGVNGANTRILQSGVIDYIEPRLTTGTGGGLSAEEIVASPAVQQYVTTTVVNNSALANLSEQTGYVYALTDNNGKIALGVRPTGGVNIPALENNFIPTQYKTPEGANRNIVSGPDIVCWGDSLTAGAGGNTAVGSFGALTNGYPQVLATLTGRTVRNAGVGGESSPTITARTGVTPFIMLPAGNQIPASGGVTVTIAPIAGSTVAPLVQGTGTGGSFLGSLAGVPGSLSVSSGVYTFTRSNAGTAVTVPRPIPFRTDFSEARRGDIAILWLGQNGPSDARAISDMKLIIDHLNTLNKRWLVMNKPTSTDAFDNQMQETFGRRFIAIRKYLVDYGLSDAAITPTAQDNTDIAAGVVPTSLRIDGVHGNSAYYNIVAAQVDRRLREFGWV